MFKNHISQKRFALPRSVHSRTFVKSLNCERFCRRSQMSTPYDAPVSSPSIYSQYAGLGNFPEIVEETSSLSTPTLLRATTQSLARTDSDPGYEPVLTNTDFKETERVAEEPVLDES